MLESQSRKTVHTVFIQLLAALDCKLHEIMLKINMVKSR